MLILQIGSIELSIRANRAEQLAEEVNAHLGRVIGSRGEVSDWVNRKYGPITLVSEVAPAPANKVVLKLRNPSETIPLDRNNLRRGDSNEVAISYLIGRFICRRLVDLAEVRRAPPLPSGRRLAELLAIQRSAIPKSLYVALEQLHVIGFTGLPSGHPTCHIQIANVVKLPVYGTDALGLQGEVEELLGRMREKITRLQNPEDEEEPVTIRTELDDSTLRIDSEDWSATRTDLAVFQWVMVHLLRPRKPNPFLPMRPLLVRPQDLSAAAPLPTGIFLPDLPAIRNQLMPAKVARLMEDIHKHGRSYDENLKPAEILCRFGRLRLLMRGESEEALAQRSRQIVAPLAKLFATEGGGADKYGEVTLKIEVTNKGVQFLSREFRPGCPDEILCEFLVATFLQDDTIPMEIVRDAPILSGRTLLNSPAIARQLMPSGTVDLLTHVHSGVGGNRAASGWRHQRR